ncbi:MAG: histidine kinase [Candidatus Dactylopiibacterium carminicum]|uniref:Histidine kinase n=1 Tax=Candidatus Dactylopiibacterium carminicum TaxID=857335 RepID=A0A272EPE7_9RHOO|nr:sensor domain-containing diguanylate cyclase [Candidatus Dactylopiibacterium carminicum]KAF7599138.1 histidine kinase [Candidatus Dactylopiibacterium carminicum]PAS91993.1 MAG: histidine kinase [Candidatus Dactylopiibacterium carminicum]PAS95261.1 MAG: histidine kinase [Candidatus Dactylopiibacterium carminicum]PAS99156.1 MAG: histidine kinase [Candidatus Dactylopiibacterium carminicum]
MTSTALPPDALPALFEHAPISLWLEDFSAVHALFESWREQGVEDLQAHFAEDLGHVDACASAIRVLRVNYRTLEMFGAPDFTTLNDRLGDVFRDDMRTQHARDMVALWNGSHGFASQSVNYALDGRRIDVLVNVRILPGHEHDWSRVIVALEDITPRVRAQKQLERSERYALGLFEHSPVSLWVEDFSRIKQLLDELRRMGIEDFHTFLDVHPEFVTRCMQEIVVLDVNVQTLKTFGAENKEDILANLGRIFRDDMHQHFAEQLLDLWQDKLFTQRETINYSLNGQAVHVHMQFSVLPGHEQDWSLVLVSLTDITARKKAEAYLEFLGRHDALTKLSNRAYYEEELKRLTRKGSYPVSVVIADLNGLKIANDELGHSVGDDLLRRAGEALRKTVGEEICAARIGGDEFALLLQHCDEIALQETLERLRAVVDLNNQFYTGPRLSFAIGSAVCHTPADLMPAVQQADAKMYEAKRDFYQQQGMERRAKN